MDRKKGTMRLSEESWQANSLTTTYWSHSPGRKDGAYSPMIDRACICRCKMQKCRRGRLFAWKGLPGEHIALPLSTARPSSDQPRATWYQHPAGRDVERASGCAGNRRQHCNRPTCAALSISPGEGERGGGGPKHNHGRPAREDDQ
jgi:hypothetical protein